MLKTLHCLLQMPNTHSLRNLLHHSFVLSLSRTRFLYDPRFLPPKITGRCGSSHRLFGSGNQGSGEESMVWPGSGEPAERPRVWTGFEPLEDELATGEEESSNGEAVHRAEDSAQKRPSRRVKDSDEDSSLGDEKQRVWSFYDPLAGQFITKVAEEETLEEEPSRMEGIPGKGNPAQKTVAMRSKKFGAASTEEEEKNMVSSGSNLQAWSSVVRKSTGKVKVSWVCENCGATPGQWWGACPSCQAAGSLKQFSQSEVSRSRGAEVSEAAVRSWFRQKPGSQVPQSLAEVNRGRDQSEWRIPLSGLFGMEVARVLGGGLVPGSLVLVGGDPGVGKSTLLLQVAAIIAQGHGFKEPAPVIYVSGEESIEQIGNRADRMRVTTPDLYLYSSTDIEDILDKIQVLSPQALIVDSIQTVYLRGVSGSAGSITQVKECTSALLRFSKQTNIPVLLIGHVTKTGDIAGPRMLEHIVDAVLYMEGERYSSYRLLRSVKNRFGSTDELGVFEMKDAGLEAVLNPSEMFISDNFSDSEILVGLAVAVIVDGSRAFVIEIQALCVSGSIARHVNGVGEGRAIMIISVLMKQAGLKLQENTIFLNVVSGFKLEETAGDLAIAAAICSSFLEFPIPNDIAFIGEVGLGGEIRAVPRIDRRVIAVAKLGYKKCVIPKTAVKSLASLNLDIEVLGCRTLKEMIDTVFQGN